MLVFLRSLKWLIYEILFLHSSISSFWTNDRTITIKLLYFRFTYYGKDNQQECSRLSNCFSLGVLGCRLTICLLYGGPHFGWCCKNNGWSVNWYRGKDIFIEFLHLIMFVYIAQALPIIFLPKCFFTMNNFSYYVRCTVIFHTHSFDSLLFDRLILL